jgi:ActR/RegA family two-component response regulator
MNESPSHKARPRILIADDEESFLRSLAVLLERQGYACDCAADGFEAIRCLENETYDLFISDIRMPGNQNLDLVQKLPARNEGLMVILVTGYPTVPTAIQAVQLPILAYLVKPLDFEALLGHLKRGLGYRQVAGALADSSRMLERWLADMKTLRAAFQASPQAALRGTLNGALTLAMGNLAGTIVDLQALFQLSAGLDAGREACEVQSCPRLATLEQAIQEGIEVLETTKETFHSRRLRDLRQKLEALLPRDDRAK